MTNLEQAKLSRRAMLSAVALAPVAIGVARGSFAAVDSAESGEWSAPFDMGGVAIHALLLRTDDCLVFQDVEGDVAVDRTSWVGTWNWRSDSRQEATFGYDRDIFCTSHNVLPDGRVFIAGGHDYTTGGTQDGVGVAETDIYDPSTRVWTPGPLLGEKRWYPTNVGLPDGRTLVFGGQARRGVPSNTVDEYDPANNSMRRLPPSATRAVGSYPKMHLLANGRVIKSGPDMATMYFNPSTSRWATVTSMRYGDRPRGSVALLTGARKVLAVGGRSAAGVTATAEILDTSRSTPRWRYTGSLTHPRQLLNTVVLPDGQVLAVGGGQAFKYTGPVNVPELYDPVTETWSVMAPQQASRMYHATALLLPDGRVLSAGQDDGPLAQTGEIFSPPYLFRGPRPTISAAPARVAHGRRLQVSTPEATGITRMVLVRPGSSTHGVDTDQRSVALRFTVSGTLLNASVPTNANKLPRGFYMLFVVNGDGVPSVATWIRVG